RQWYKEKNPKQARRQNDIGHGRGNEQGLLEQRTPPARLSVEYPIDEDRQRDGDASSRDCQKQSVFDCPPSDSAHGKDFLVVREGEDGIGDRGVVELDERHPN